MKDNCQCRGIQGQPKNFGRQFLADAPGIIKQTLMSEVRKGTCSDKGLSKEIIACGWLSKCLEGLLQKRLQNLKPSQVWLKMPQFTCAESCANERKRRNFFISIKFGRTEMWWLHQVLRFIKKIPNLLWTFLNNYFFWTFDEWNSGLRRFSWNFCSRKRELAAKRQQRVAKQWGESHLLQFHLFYKQFFSVVERGGAKFTKINEVRNILNVPLVVTIKKTNQIDLHVCKNIHQSVPAGQIMTLSSAW